MPTNQTFDVQGYVDDHALPILENRLGITRTLDREYENWDKPKNYGTRGDTFNCKLPTRLNADDGLTFDSTNPADGSFQERILPVTADQQKNVRYAITDIEQAVFDTQGLVRSNPLSALNELAISMDSFSARSVALRGYRAFGDFDVQAGQMQTVAEVTNAVAVFQSFGCGSKGYYAMPMGVSAQIVQSGLQQFVMKRNEDMAVKGELGELGGVPDTTFLTTNLLPTHIAGTASEDATNFSTGYQINSITVTAPSNTIGGNQAGTTAIALSGGTTGKTIVENDMIDIGFLADAPLNYLTFTGYIPSEQTVQARVTSGGSFDGSGNLTITVEPALIFDATNTNVSRNLSRAIVTGGTSTAFDTLRVAKSHRCGAIYLGEYGKFVCPPLPMKEPYPTGSKISPDLQVSVRAYYGATALGFQTKYFVQDAIFGFGGAAEGFGRVLLPLK